MSDREAGAAVPDPSRRSRHCAALLLTVFAVAVLLIVFWPGPPQEQAQQGLAQWLRLAHSRGLPEWISFALVERTSNVIMFLPLGFLGALALPPRRVWLVVPACALTSAAIELVQLIVLPARTSSWADIATNTAGALLGLLLALPILRRRRAQARRASSGRRLAGSRS